MTYVDDWTLDDTDDIEWDINDNWDDALRQLDCTNGNAVCLFSRGMVFEVPARCKRLRVCESCRKWAWGRQLDHMGGKILTANTTQLWLGLRITDRELTAISERRRKMDSSPEWALVNLPEGRTFIATADLTQLRGRRFPKGRMVNVEVDHGLGALGDAYTRPDAMRRQTCRTWKIPTRATLLRFGARLRIQQAIKVAFGPDGNAWDDTKNRRLTPGEIIARFNEAYADAPD